MQKRQKLLQYGYRAFALRRHGEAIALCSQSGPCIVVYRVPGPERARNFDSQAIISVGPYVYFDGDDLIADALMWGV